jgi:hypothetical protein
LWVYIYVFSKCSAMWQPDDINLMPLALSQCLVNPFF